MKAAKIIDYIVNWLHAYCKESGLKGFVAGVSGGIDSAVASALCARTGFETILLNMPIYQNPDQFSLSSQHIKWLEKQFPNVKGYETDLTSPFAAIQNVLPDHIQDDLTMANTRSRLRMLTLYAFAASNQLLVAGTGNKVEDFGIGFYTKYGDGGVDLSPIADLMKTEVFALGKELNIMDPILKAAPTDGLWEDGRTDESQIGATYPELEWAMKFDKKGNDPEQLDARQQEVLAIFKRLNRANRHKMEPIPVCVIPANLK